MKKICFISLRAYQLFNSKFKTQFGGAEVQMTLFARQFSADPDFDVHFICADYGQDELEEYNKVRVWKSMNFNTGLLQKIFSFFRVFSNVNADIYVQRTMTQFSWIIALYCKFKKKKFIYMLAHDREIDGTHEIYKNKFIKRLYQYVFKTATVVICQNEFQERLVKYIRKDHVYLLPSGYPITEQNKETDNTVLWVSRSAKFKKPELFIKLAEELPEYKFVMICPKAVEDEILYEKVKLFSSKISNLNFIPFVSFDEIGNYFLKARVFINTSDKEGFPNTFIQSAIAGTPIISLKVNPDHFITKRECGIFCDGEYIKMRDGLKRLFEDDDYYNRLSSNLVKYAKEYHDIEKNSKLFKEIIQKS